MLGKPRAAAQTSHLLDPGDGLDPGEIDRAGLQPARFGIGTRRIDRDVHGPDLAHQQVAAVGPQRTERDVGIAAGEIDRRRSGQELDRNGRMALHEGRQPRHNDHARHVFGRRDADLARQARLRRRGFALDRMHGRFDGLRPRQNAPPRFGQHVSGGTVFEQPCSQPLLQRFDMTAHRRGPCLEQPRGLGQASRPRHGQEVLQIIPFHRLFETGNPVADPCSTTIPHPGR